MAGHKPPRRQNRRASNWGGARQGAGRKKKATDQPRVSFDALLALVERSQEQARNRPRTDEWNPYIIRQETHFGPVGRKVPKELRMAMDSGIAQANSFAVQAWQAGGMLNNVVSEGLLFLGYPYLSELAQRPEFRLFGEIRAQEMTRKWVEFRGTQDESTKDSRGTAKNRDDEERRDKRPRSDARNKEIEAKIKELKDFEKDLRVRAWFQNVAAQDAFMGISHLYLDLRGADANTLNDPELKTDIGNGRDRISAQKLDKGCLRGMRTVEPIWVYPTTYNASNPLVESWYDPQVWYVMGTEIHKSRLLTFIGRPVPDILKPAYAFGGLSMTQMAQPYVDIWLKTRQAVGQIVHAYSVMVLMTNLATLTQSDGTDVLARAIAFNALRDNQGLFVVDKATEDFKNVSVPLSGLDELQAQAQEHMFSVGRIPAVKFAGIQPKGLNATSEGELRAFYDTIAGEQEHLFRTNLTTVYDIMQISLWGQRDPDITYDFVPLWELTAKEKAEVRKIEAEIGQIHIDSGVISQEEERTRIANDPDSGYDSIDPEDMPDLLDEEESGLEPQGGRPQPLAEIGAAEHDAPKTGDA